MTHGAVQNRRTTQVRTGGRQQRGTSGCDGDWASATDECAEPKPSSSSRREATSAETRDAFTCIITVET